MRVLAVCDYLSSASGGGAERVAREVNRRLADEHDVDLLAVGLAPRGAPTVSEPLGGYQVVKISGHDLSRALGIQLAVSAGARGAVRRELDRFCPDIVHAHGMYFQGSVAAAAAARSADVPFVVTAHIGSSRFLPEPARRAVQLWDYTVGRRVLGSASAIVAISPSVASHLGDLGVNSDRLVSTVNGVDHSVFHPGVQNAGGPLEVVFLGRLIANKGPDVALEAFARLRSAGYRARLTFMGDGPLRQRLERRSRRLGVGEDVSFAGLVSDVAGRLRNFHVLIRPSRTEGMPLAVLEAMASGVVVACSAIPGNLDLVRPEHNGLAFPVGDAAAAAGALRRLTVDESLYTRLRGAALCDAKRFTWQATATAHLEAFRRALSMPLSQRAAPR